MWHTILHLNRPLAWSIKHPGGVVYSRRTFAEAIEVAHDLSTAMKKHGIEHHRCRVYRTYMKVA